MKKVKAWLPKRRPSFCVLSILRVSFIDHDLKFHMTHVNTRSRLTIVALQIFFGLVIYPAEMSAQNGLTAVKRNDLAIGNITVGQVLHIVPQSPAAAKFEVRSTTNIDIAIQIILPSRLQEIGGRSELGVTFSADCARWSLNDNVENSTSFDPHAPLRVSLGPNQSVIIWLGAFVDPPTSLQAGRYTSSITLSAIPVAK
jgi:hypothetical protein